MGKSTQESDTRDESGFSLVELMVAMAILIGISLSLLPLLINGIKTSSSTTTLATASQIAASRLELAAAQPSTCSHFNDNSILTQYTKVDPRGVTLVIQASVGACPTSFPSTRIFTVTVTRQDTNAVLITATTLLYLTGS